MNAAEWMKFKREAFEKEATEEGRRLGHIETSDVVYCTTMIRKERVMKKEILYPIKLTQKDKCAIVGLNWDSTTQSFLTELLKGGEFKSIEATFKNLAAKTNKQFRFLKLPFRVHTEYNHFSLCSIEENGEPLGWLPYKP